MQRQTLAVILVNISRKQEVVKKLFENECIEDVLGCCIEYAEVFNVIKFIPTKE